MVAIKRQSGPECYPYNRRAKIGQFEWGGMIPDGSPGSLPPNRPRALFNTRLQAGSYVARPGQEAVYAELDNPAALVRYLEDFQITRKSLVTVMRGCPDFDPAAGFSIGTFDQEQSPALQANVYYDTASGALNAGKFGDDLFIGHDAELRKYQPIDVPYDETALSASGQSQDVKLFEAPGAFTKITNLKEFDGKLFVCYDGRIVIWDGVTETIDLDGIGTPTGSVIFRDQLVIGYNGTPNHIRVRSAGAAPGTWATVTPSAGTTKFLFAASYKNNLYITTNDDYLMKWDGTTLDPIVAATLGTGAGSFLRGIAVFNGYLYVSYQTAASNFRIARFDGTTWVAVHKNMTTQFADIDFALPLVEFRGSLVLGGGDSALGGSVWVSPGTATSGTWVAHTLGDLSGDIFDLVVP